MKKRKICISYIIKKKKKTSVTKIKKVTKQINRKKYMYYKNIIKNRSKNKKNKKYVLISG